MNGGYSVCLNKWALDKEIKNELGLLLIISSLCAEKGYCFASNEYLATLFEIEEETISRKLNKLSSKDYITIEYEKRGCEIISRKIRLTEISIDDCQKNQPTIDEKVKDNNIIYNNISINNKKEIYKEKRFKPPTLEEIEQYIKEKKLNVNAKDFYDYFTDGKWIDSRGNKVYNWKLKLRTWNSYNKRTITYQIKTPNWFDKNTDIEVTNDMEDIFKDLGE